MGKWHAFDFEALLVSDPLEIGRAVRQLLAPNVGRSVRRCYVLRAVARWSAPRARALVDDMPLILQGVRMSPAFNLCILVPTVVVSTSVAAAPAQAQTDSAAIQFEADEGELVDRNGRATLAGNVRIKHGEVMLTASRVTLTYTGNISNGSPEISRVYAVGAVTISRPGQKAQSQYGVYDLSSRIITMVGGVVLRQSGNVLSGNRLTLNLETRNSILTGSGSYEAPTYRNDHAPSAQVTGRLSDRQ